MLTTVTLNYIYALLSAINLYSREQSRKKTQIYSQSYFFLLLEF